MDPCFRRDDFGNVYVYFQLREFGGAIPRLMMTKPQKKDAE
jgi:hypothetical protein